MRNADRPLYGVVTMLGALRYHARRIAKDQIGPRVTPRLPRRTDLPLDTFGLRVAGSGRLHLGSADLVDLTERYGSPLHVVDGARLDAAATHALAPLRDPDRAGSDIFYSYKTNPVPAVLRRLHAAGIGAEVISEYELWLALRLGVPGERIIYNGPAKSPASIRLAVERGVASVNANTVAEVARIAAIAAEVGQPARLGLRVALPGGWGGQFGISSDLQIVAPLVTDALADPSLDLTAIHVHRGGTIRTRDDVAGHVHQIVGFVDALRVRTGWAPRTIDVGGSLSCPTVAGFDQRQFRLNRLLGSDLLPPDPTDAITLEAASELAADLVGDWARSCDVQVPNVVMEPGKALTANSQLLLTTVVDVKSDIEPDHAILDAGINLADTAAHEFHQLYSATDASARCDHPYRLTGPICTPADVLYNNWRLPELTPGHVLAIMDAGAYFVPFSTSFSFPRPAIVMVDDGAVEIVRERETFDDLVRLDAESDRAAT